MKEKIEKIGSTSKFPQGKLKSDDEGELRMAIFEKEGNIVIDFGKDLSWIGFGKKEAIELGELLINKAKNL
jgi:hypothetical protein